MAETTKLSLGIKDRIVLPTFFPDRSNFVDQILKEDIKGKIQITQEEITKIGLHYSEPDKDGKQFMTWNNANAPDKEVEFTQAEIRYLKKQVDRLDKEAALSDEMMIIAKEVRRL